MDRFLIGCLLFLLGFLMFCMVVLCIAGTYKLLTGWGTCV